LKNQSGSQPTPKWCGSKKKKGQRGGPPPGGLKTSKGQGGAFLGKSSGGPGGKRKNGLQKMLENKTGGDLGKKTNLGRDGPKDCGDQNPNFRKYVKRLSKFDPVRKGSTGPHSYPVFPQRKKELGKGRGKEKCGSEREQGTSRSFFKTQTGNSKSQGYSRNKLTELNSYRFPRKKRSTTLGWNWTFGVK